VHMRVVTVGLLVLGGMCVGSLLTAAGSLAAPAPPAPGPAIAQQPPAQPVSTIPPIVPVSTIPPIPPTPTTARAVPQTSPPPSPAATSATPVIPTLSPTRPPATTPASAQSAPRAGGFPTEVAVLVLAGSVTALGGGLSLFARSKRR
jgi:hypothetical protein